MGTHNNLESIHRFLAGLVMGLGIIAVCGLLGLMVYYDDVVQALAWAWEVVQ